MITRSSNFTLEDTPTFTAGAPCRVSIVIVVLVIVAATLNALRKDVTQGFDEVAHASYVAHIQSSGRFWPALTDMRMLEPAQFHFTAAPNYLNHPPPYYALLAALGPTLEGHPEAIIFHRLLNIAFVALALVAVLMIGVCARLPSPLFYAYAVPLACVPVLGPLAGAINNDNAAFAGGAFTMLGAWQLVATGRTRWLGLALGGVLIAAWAKLTGLLLAGGLLTGVLLWLLWRRRVQMWWAIPVALVGLLAALPYAVLFLQYGSPTPNTPGQLALLQDGARLAGWDRAARMSLLSYAAYFMACFVAEWMPVLMPRNALNYAVLALPLGAGVCAAIGVVLSIRRIVHRKDAASDVVVVAGASAFAMTFVLHIVFSYQRHLAFGWMMDAYPRYYLPLIAVVPLAGLSLLEEVRQRRLRQMMVWFFIAGPIVFRLLAAPLD